MTMVSICIYNCVQIDGQLLIQYKSLNLSRIVCWINISVLGNFRKNGYNKIVIVRTISRLYIFFFSSTYYLCSTLAVASSITRILFWRRMAWARQTNCLWPTDKFEPPPVTMKCNPKGNSFIDSLNFTASRAVQRLSSLYSSNGSNFLRKVPEKRNGFCGIIEILERRSWRPIVPVSIPSIISLSSGSVIRKRAEINGDFPAPVFPTIPILKSVPIYVVCRILLFMLDILNIYLFFRWNCEWNIF